jgi:hypothetical protein
MMKKRELITKILIYILLLGLSACSSRENVLTINDESGVFHQTNSPLSIEAKLNNSLSKAAREGRLGLSDPSLKDGNKSLIPIQLEKTGDGTNSKVVMILSNGEPSLRKYKMVETESPFSIVMKATLDPNSGQVIIGEDGKNILQYNYQTVYEKDVIRLPNKEIVKPEFSSLTGVYLEEYLKENPVIKKDTLLTTSVYAVPRSDYIHPLYGMEGEMVTRDWPDGGHPHHRGIFWAWPEVEYGSQRGDLYALQRVFARPTGKIECINGPVFAQVVAENLWMWENIKPIVHELAVIRVYRATSSTRIIDLTIKLDALEDSITIATRGTASYGGLNLRMQTPESQNISYFTDKTNSNPLRAWSDFSGIFKGAESTTGLMVLQYKGNPDYPGSWREYPDLAWVQPTFPTPGTRFPLSTKKPLILRYRLIVHSGSKPDELISRQRWDAFNETLTPLYTFK